MTKQATPIILFIGLTLLIGCQKRIFTQEEQTRIETMEDSEIMPLFTINSTTDSLFLHQTAREVDADIINNETFVLLQKRMLATVTNPDNEGVGIAAPQVGVGIRMIYVQRLDKPEKPFEFYLNPQVISAQGAFESYDEGCLSVPGFRGEVQRQRQIEISYIDSTGQEKKENIQGFTAVIFQHEIDHLNGVLYYEHVNNGLNGLISN